MEFCSLNYIYMEFDEYMKNGSGLNELTEDRKLKKSHVLQLKITSLTGVQWNMEFPKDQFQGLYCS